MAAASGGDLICTGATVTKHGSPTSSSMYGYPLATQAATLSGATSDYYSAPVDSVLNFSSDFFECVAFRADSLAGTPTLVANNDANGYYAEIFTNGTFSFGVLPGASLNVSGVVVGVENLACFGLAGSTAMVQLNGGTVATLGGKTMTPAEREFRLGAYYGSHFFTGSIARFSAWSGTPTSAIFSSIYRSWAGELAKKPLGAAISVTSDPQLCCPVDDAHCYNLAANQLCVTSAGAGIWGAPERSNRLDDSDLAAWGVDGSATLVGNSASCPLIPVAGSSTHMALFTGAAGTDMYDGSSAAGCRGVWAALATGDSACHIVSSAFSGTPSTHTLGATITRFMDYDAGASGMILYPGTGGCARFCVWRATAQNTTVCTTSNPAPATAGAAYVGNADVVSTATTLTDPSRWCVGVKAMRASGQPGRILGLGTAYGNNSMVLEFDGNTLYYDERGPVQATDYHIGTATVGGGEKTIVACSDRNLYVNGVVQSLSALQASGARMAAIPAVLYIGSTAGTAVHSGTYSKVCQASTYAACARCLQ